MTVVDGRGKRVPASLRGREFSGPPPGERPRSSGRDNRGGGDSWGDRQGRGGRESPDGRPAPDRPTARSRSAGTRSPALARTPVSTHVGSSRRPGASIVWLIAVIVGMAGVGIGAAIQDATGRAALIGYVVAAPVAAGLVRRGRCLRQLLLCLPLAFLADFTIAGAIELSQSGLKVTSKGALEQAAQVLVLHSPWLWAGTLLAVVVGVRRGLFRRIR